MSKFLELRFTKFNTNSLFQITHQSSNKISYADPDTGIRLRCESNPQWEGTVLYLRGNISDRDWTTLAVGPTTLLDIFGILVRYTKAKNRKIDYRVSEDKLFLYVTIYTESSENGKFINDNGDNKISELYEQWKYNLTSISHFFSLQFPKLPNGSSCSLCSTDVESFTVTSGIFTCANCIPKQCKNCSATTNKLIKCKSASGVEYELCNQCSKVSSTKCGHTELRFLIETSLLINSNGDTVNESVCSKCKIDKNYRECGNCGRLFSSKICPCKIPEDFVRYIHPYNFNVLEVLKFDRLPNGNLPKELFGIEIEAGISRKDRENYRQVYDEVVNLIGKDAVLVYDSSIDYINKAEGVLNTYRGFEIVTRPMQYRNLKSFIERFTKNRPSLLYCWKVDTTGIHIHVSKSCLSRIDIGKILLFINSKKNRNFITFISRRESKRFARFKNKRITDYKNINTEAHYEAVNTSKPHTIEFRIFKGSLKYETIISYLQFVKSLIEFIKITKVSELDYKTYINWLFTTNRSNFRELKSYVKLFNPDGKFEVINEDEEI